MYLDLNLLSKIDSNNFYYTTSTTQECISLEKGYSIIEHAYTLLNNKDSLYLEDVISNLRKAFNYRIKDIYKNLGIDKLNISFGNTKKLEKLEYLDIVKPLLMSKLLNIRNGIEQYGHNPPSKNECRELIDVVWYFYRTTDIYCSRTPIDWEVEWQEEGKKCFLCINFDLSEHKILRIIGRCPEKYLSESKKAATFIPLKNVNINNNPDNDFVKNYNYHPYSFEAEIEVKELPLYLKIFSLALKNWRD